MLMMPISCHLLLNKLHFFTKIWVMRIAGFPVPFNIWKEITRVATITMRGLNNPLDDMYDAMNILKLVDGAIGLADKRGSMVHKGIFTIFRVLLFSFMTDYYGDVYYSEALKAREGILYPKYDKQADIYTGLLKELDDANTLIATGTEAISPTYDLVFKGNKLQWQKFANSLKLRLLMRASNKIPDAGTQIAAIVNNPVRLHPYSLLQMIMYLFPILEPLRKIPGREVL